MSTAMTNPMSLLTRFTHEAHNAPKMPMDIRELVLPTQFRMPIIAPVDKPLRKSKKEKRRERMATAPPQSATDLLVGEDGDEEAAEQVPVVQPTYRKNRYIPNFDVKTNRCWWDWVPFELDADGKEKYDFEYESGRAYSDFYAENYRREKQRAAWWNQNPQSGYQAPAAGKA